jgi:ATP-dependent DNA ligase
MVKRSTAAPMGWHSHAYNNQVFLYAFDLLELNGDHLRREPLETRKDNWSG